jgi:hypothetical protein
MSAGSENHLPAFSVDPPGVLVLRRHWDDGSSWLTIAKADPQVEFSDELLQDFAEGGDNDGMYPDVELDQSPDHHDGTDCPEFHTAYCFTDCLVRINGRDRTVIYRIGEYVAKSNSWVGRWPD